MILYCTVNRRRLFFVLDLHQLFLRIRVGMVAFVRYFLTQVNPCPLPNVIKKESTNIITLRIMVNGRESRVPQKRSRPTIEQLATAGLPAPTSADQTKNTRDNASPAGLDKRSPQADSKSLTDSDDLVRSPEGKLTLLGRSQDGPGGQPMFLPVSVGVDDDEIRGDEFDPQKFLIFVGGFKDR